MVLSKSREVIRMNKKKKDLLDLIEIALLIVQTAFTVLAYFK